MGVRRLNHAVLYVRDLGRSRSFYADVLGFEPIRELPGAVFLRAPESGNDHDLGLFEVGLQAGPSGAGTSTVGLYHLAWSVGTLAELAAVRDRLADAGALVGASDHVTSKSLYAKDPDGLEFEVAWFVPREAVTAEMDAAVAIEPLDLDAELARWGADRVGLA